MGMEYKEQMWTRYNNIIDRCHSKIHWFVFNDGLNKMSSMCKERMILEHSVLNGMHSPHSFPQGTGSYAGEEAERF